MEGSFDQSASIPTESRKRKRVTACERCNRRRVRCDASVVGLPCSGCKKANNHPCALIKSKQIRGPDGRFTLQEQQTEHRYEINDDSNQQSPTCTHDKQPVKTQQLPGISLNLASLVGLTPPEDHDSLTDHGALVQTSDEKRRSMPFTAPKRRSNRANFLGESWYASYVLSISAAEHTELHRPVKERGEDRITNTDGALRGESSQTLSKSMPEDLPPPQLRDRLLEAYFTRFHVYCPILDRTNFLTSILDETVSITLLRSVMFVASVHCDPEIYHLMGYSSRFDVQDDLFEKAKASFDAEDESDRTTMVLSAYLLHYYWGQPTTFRDSFWWLSSAIRSAQCMGYHRDTRHSRMSAKDKSQFKRIWWCLYIRDRQISLSAGAPMIINDLECDIEELTVEDLQDESPETAYYVVAQASLNRVAANAYFCHCSPTRLRLNADPITRKLAREEIQQNLQQWYRNLPKFPESKGRSHHLYLLLQILYHFYILNLQQRLQRQCRRPPVDPEGSEIIIEAANNITQLTQQSLLYWSPEWFPMICVSAIFTAMASHYVQFISQRDILVERLQPNLLALKQFEQCYILARWVRNLWMDIMDHPKRPNQDLRPGDISRNGSKHQPQRSSPQISNSTNDQLTPQTNESLFNDQPMQESIQDNFVFEPPYPGSNISSFFTPDELWQQEEFPDPNSSSYHSMHFLADIGLRGFDQSFW